ncbi:hypothetical protein AC792_13635 [Arthrobacter sp. RIT-PI-e]|uniref:hypothetical protein n=1 Tax=Arthrobacter sp. RIT-PI-e TaxID=1681197 RepID=UPI00067688A8|nr:hypothetical protein [Arthrobacter sp. RIT-PI-e]KNC17874.1 hypothetical protein AC792_13635 [Arthrobacter sp. RIT-PI-e]
MIHRDQHTRLTITTPVLDPTVLTTLSEDLSPTIALDLIINFTSLLDSRITRIDHTLTQHRNHRQPQHHAQQHHQDAHEAHHRDDSSDDDNSNDGGEDDRHVEALLSMRNGAAMAGARRLELIATSALSRTTKGSIAVEPLIRQLMQEARRFKAAAARIQQPNPHLAA